MTTTSSQLASSQGIAITVVIPTRDRAVTLKSALASCVCQDYPHLEILVSDNCSVDDTRDVVAACPDPRVRYVNTGRRVGMSQNWEFALDQIADGYVLFLGDDDALLPGALTAIDAIVRRTGCRALSWESASYVWPDTGDRRRSNVLQVPLRSGLVREDARAAVKQVLAGRRRYTDLNFLYRGLVHREVLEQAKGESGRFFHSLNPDVYSGIAVACTVSEFYYSKTPYSVNGTSRHSGGTAYFGQSATDAASKLFFSEDNLACHPDMPMGPANSILIAESALQARAHVPGAAALQVDPRSVLIQAAHQSKALPAAQHEAVMQALTQIARIHGLEPAYVERLRRQYRWRPQPMREEVLGVNFVHGYLRLNATEFGVTDVANAAVLCQHVLTYRGSRYHSNVAAAKTVLGLAYREFRHWLTTVRNG